MTYAVKEMFLTLQGEGAQAGRAAVFCRFAGCNLWSGREQDRATAQCRFCDTDFVGTDGAGGGRFASAETLADAILACWSQEVTDTPGGAGLKSLVSTSSAQPKKDDDDQSRRYVVMTGGEPALQLDNALISALHERDFEVAIETNGTLPLPAGIDWVCVSPKAGTTIQVQSGDELKVVVPQMGFSEADWLAMAQWAFKHHFVQPMADLAGVTAPASANAATWAVNWCLRHPRWRLSMQSHKWLGIQ